MSYLNIYKITPHAADIAPIKIKRDWMDDTDKAHAYKCFPVTLTNSLGLGVSFPEDIEFVWDGISDSTGVHVEILKGHDYVYTGRANATISFHSGLKLESDENTSVLHMPVPNQFVDGAQAFTTIISTSFYKSPMPIAWRITRPNVPILIPANQPVVSFVPISTKAISDVEINYYGHSPEKFGNEYWAKVKAYGDKAQEINMTGEWTNFYRNATDENGISQGDHEVKTIKMKFNDLEQK